MSVTPEIEIFALFLGGGVGSVHKSAHSPPTGKLPSGYAVYDEYVGFKAKVVAFTGLSGLVPMANCFVTMHGINTNIKEVT